MPRPKKIDEGEELEPLIIEELVEEPVTVSAPEVQTVSINGKEYKQWTDAAGCTFVEPL